MKSLLVHKEGLHLLETVDIEDISSEYFVPAGGPEEKRAREYYAEAFRSARFEDDWRRFVELPHLGPQQKCFLAVSAAVTLTLIVGVCLIH